jgi:hypothetical protein
MVPQLVILPTLSLPEVKSNNCAVRAATEPVAGLLLPLGVGHSTVGVEGPQLVAATDSGRLAEERDAKRLAAQLKKYKVSSVIASLIIPSKLCLGVVVTHSANETDSDSAIRQQGLTQR